MNGSVPSRRDWAGTIAPWIALVTLTCGVVYRFAALEEAKAIAVNKNVEQDRAIEKHDERLRAIETARKLELQVERLTAKIESLESQVSNMREELARKRR